MGLGLLPHCKHWILLLSLAHERKAKNLVATREYSRQERPDQALYSC